ncbi:MAG: polysaccharide biosynthesis tyrosine autokinase [Candidatus Omnitrophica bacterium]|nr:polysaccharide biosynthesis tyrosine autokinase [Candidatus Omnitrophota bacterium]MCB9747899.1 polysaccharide biosynthesis tyrosine autokinase [Candidatus Omnitrophota bacterium]
MDHYEISLAEYFRIIRKRKWTILSVFSLVFLSTVMFTKSQPKVFQAYLELRIENQQNMAEQLQNPQARFTAVNLASEMREITSLPVMQKVVEKLEVLSIKPEEREEQLFSLSRQYQARTHLEQIRDTNIINLKVESNDPQHAVLTASAIADIYMIENVQGRQKRFNAQLEYIDEQLANYQKQILENEDLLQKFKQNEKVFEVTGAVKETLDRMTIEGTFEFESEMLEIDEQLRNLKVYFEENRSGINDILKERKIEDDFIFIGLKRRLLEMEFERFLLLIDYTEKHPAVLGQEQAIADVKLKIVEMMKKYSGITINIDNEADLSLIIKELFLEVRRDVIFRIVNRFYEESGSLSTNQLEYVKIKRNIDRLLASHDTLLKRREEIELELAKIIDDVVTIVSPARASMKPIKPKAGVNYGISTVVGLILGIIVAFIKESVDSSVSSISDVEKELSLTMLGIIPYIKKEEVLEKRLEEYDYPDKKIVLQRARLVTITNPKSWPAESIKMLRTNLVQLMKTKNLKSILFTSSDKQEGKSTIVTNIALSMAQLGKKTILVGSNMRRPTSFKIFGLEREPGLSDILMGNVAWKDAVRTASDILIGGLEVDNLLQMPGIDNLNIITCGRRVDNVSELINSNAYNQLMKELKNQYDVIIIDCSPVMAVPDAITLCDKVDGVVLVYKVGHTSKDVLRMAKSNLLSSGGNILGIVLNSIKTEAQVGYSAYYYRYYSDATPPKENLVQKWKNQFDRESKKNEEEEFIV